MGLGNTPIDFQVYGVNRDQSRARFAEAAEVILAAWSNERFSHHGDFWTFDDVPVYPRPVQQPTPPLWVAGSSAESFGWAGRHGASIMTVAHPLPPERYRAGYDAWREGLAEAGLKPTERHCKIHLRVWVEENGAHAREVAEDALARYDALSAYGRRPTPYDRDTYDWEGMLAAGRNCYGNPDQCIRAIQRAIENYEFDIFSTTFNFGGLPHEEVKKSMRLFAQEVMPAFKDVQLTMAPRTPAASAT
jgi:alkanesulfonate monooxygenase SsuD/methylene tetrahydromethanopterin reductase-like flavin-dependent oxidoreductase (luciferase family)